MTVVQADAGLRLWSRGVRCRRKVEHCGAVGLVLGLLDSKAWLERQRRASDGSLGSGTDCSSKRGSRTTGRVPLRTAVSRAGGSTGLKRNKTEKPVDEMQKTL